MNTKRYYKNQYVVTKAIIIFDNLQINEIIETCISEVGIAPVQYNDTDIEIVLVENAAQELRGFVGFNVIYVHSSHFQTKIDSYKGDDDLLDSILKIDLICLAIHELSHIRIRKVSINKVRTVKN